MKGTGMIREELKTKGLTDEQIDYIMAENGKDVEAQKQKTANAETAAQTAKDQRSWFGVEIK
jgi:SOS response regulatory protein OraA/RecX